MTFKFKEFHINVITMDKFHLNLTIANKLLLNLPHVFQSSNALEE